MIELLKQTGHQRMLCSAQATDQSKPRLQWSGESGITDIVLPWKALLLSRILRGYVPRTEPFSFLLYLSSRRITQFFLPLDRRIGRSTVGQSFQQRRNFPIADNHPERHGPFWL